MNSNILYFLPSVIRGVYLYDESLSNIDNSDTFSQFVEGKKNFLPPKFIDVFLNAASTNSHIEPITSTRKTDNTQYSTISPNAKRYIEKYPQLNESKSYLEKEFVIKVISHILSEEGLNLLIPQFHEGPYFIDFGIVGENKIALEMDGFGKFENPEALDDFLHRQNFIIKQGWTGAHHG